MPKYEFDRAAIEAMPEGAEKEKILALLAEFVAAKRRNPLEGYTPYAQQAQMHASTAGLRAFIGGNRAGKTTCGIVDDLLEVVPRELVPVHLQRWKRPEWECPRYIRIAEPSTKQILAIAVEKLREWTPKALLINGQFGKSYSKADYTLRLECGCRIDLLSYEMDLDKWGGTAQHRMHYDEEPPEAYREEGRARLTDFNGTELLTMTPQYGLTWTHDEIWLRPNDEQVFSVRASLVDNPNLSPDGVAATLASYAGMPDVLASRVHGHFVHPEGMVYPHFSEWIGETPDADWVRSCDVVCGIDPGARNFGLVWVAFDALNNAVVFESRILKGMAESKQPGTYHPEGANVALAVDEIHRVCAKWGMKVGDAEYVIDPSARSRSATSSESVESEFSDRGVYCAHGQNAVEAGVMRVRSRGEAGGLVIAGEGTEALQWESTRYRIQSRRDGKFDVLKEHDHLMDALRYALMHRAWSPPPQYELATLGPDYASPPPTPRRGQLDPWL